MAEKIRDSSFQHLKEQFWRLQDRARCFFRSPAKGRLLGRANASARRLAKGGFLGQANASARRRPRAPIVLGDRSRDLAP